MRARSPNRPQTSLRRPMAPRRPAPVTETCHWECAWWATLTADHFAGEIAAQTAGALLTWIAQPGVRVGDVYLLATTAPDRRLRAWGWVVGAPDGDDEQGWRVTVRFGGLLGDPLPLKALRDAPGLSQWSPLARVSAGRIEGIPPAVWAALRRHVQAQVVVGVATAESAAAPDGSDAAPVANLAPAPAPEPAPETAAAAGRPRRQGRPTERHGDDGTAPSAWPWDGLDRGRFFQELVRRVLMPEGFTLMELRPWRDAAGIDIIAHRPQLRWARWVAQLDVTGEPVDVAAVSEVVQGRQHHGAQSGLLIATGPVSEAVRDHAQASGVEIWDAAWLRSVWLRATDGTVPDAPTADPVSSGDWLTAMAI